MSTPGQELQVEREGGILVLTLNRPQARNAMTQALAQALARAFDELTEDPLLRVGVLTGAGGHFCSGMDLKAFLRGELPRVEGRGFGALTQAPPAKPLIAAVEGYALAGGFEMVLACDLVVASREANFGLPEVRRGLVASAGGLMRLPARIPYHVAMQYILTGDLMPAVRAEQWGLVNQLVEPGAVRESRDWPEAEMFERQARYTPAVFDSEDAKEGARAFAEKRAPVWAGR